MDLGCPITETELHVLDAVKYEDHLSSTRVLARFAT